jgi:hypothetical protein
MFYLLIRFCQQSTKILTFVAKNKIAVRVLNAAKAVVLPMRYSKFTARL